MQVIKTETFELQNESDIVYVRQLVRKLSQEIGLGLVDQTRVITAASELARNVIKYAGHGRLRWEILSQETKTGLRLVFEDEGPGIADIQSAMTDGWTSGGGLGLGLPGSKRLVNDFEIESIVGKGTRVAITRWKL
ncbi:MAG TPA: anti-sigma regulatory factor [Pirellula sp.]|nr:anti-sigma regulatory factor [Pirellula sp.]